MELIITIAIGFVSINIPLWLSLKESKDFHGRLCTLEERYRQMMEKYLENKQGKR